MDSTASGGSLLSGGKGDDTLNGSWNSDTYVFNLGDGRDTVIEEAAYSGVVDTLRFGEGINVQDLWFRQVDSNLEIMMSNAGDAVVIKDWYVSSSKRVENIMTSDGRVLLDSQVSNLVDAMASFSVPVSGESAISPEQKTQIDNIIAVNGQ